MSEIWNFQDCHIKWSLLDPKTLKPEILAAIDETKSDIQKIKNLSDDQLTYNNVFDAFYHAGAKLERIRNLYNALQTFLSTKSLRSVVKQIDPIVEEFYDSIYMDAQLFSVIDRASKIKEPLTDEQKRYISETIKDFQETGVNLPDQQKARFVELDKALSIDQNQFLENILDSKNEFEYYVTDPNELIGVPEHIITAAKRKAEAKGHANSYLFTLDEPIFFPVIKCAESEKLREAMWKGCNEQCTPKNPKFDNEPLIWKILAERKEKANLLGFQTFNDFVTNRMMSGNGKTSLTFTETLHDKVFNKFLKEVQELREYKARKTGQPVADLKPWETHFWANKFCSEILHFNEEELRPYFQIDDVISGIFSIIHNIYGVDIIEKPTYYLHPQYILEKSKKNQRKDESKHIEEEKIEEEDSEEDSFPEDNISTEQKESMIRDGIEVWNPDVKFYEVYDSKTKQLFGSFFADFYPNKLKQDGAWMETLIIGDPSKGIPHLGYLCANLTRPNEIEGIPSLLEHEEVLTIFHEMGHLMHLILSNCIQSLAGIIVPDDFSEFPSLLLENWGWNKECVDIYAKHWKTGEKISNELWNRKLSTRSFSSGTKLMGCLKYTYFDLIIHLRFQEYQAKGLNIDQVTDLIVDKYSSECALINPENNVMKYSFGRTFSHIFSSIYPAKYYSYLWSEVIEADIFKRFEKEGVLNHELGAQLREKIISKGNSKNSADMFRDFMGRDPDQKAFLERYGLV